MSSIADQKSIDISEKVPPSPDQEKQEFDATATITESQAEDGDEALKLVGRERKVKFSQEYNRKLRRKLVRPVLSAILLEDLYSLLLQDLLIPPLCAAVYFTQFLYVYLFLLFYVKYGLTECNIGIRLR